MTSLMYEMIVGGKQMKWSVWWNSYACKSKVRYASECRTMERPFEGRMPLILGTEQRTDGSLTWQYHKRKCLHS